MVRLLSDDGTAATTDAPQQPINRAASVTCSTKHPVALPCGVSTKLQYARALRKGPSDVRMKADSKGPPLRKQSSENVAFGRASFARRQCVSSKSPPPGDLQLPTIDQGPLVPIAQLVPVIDPGAAAAEKEKRLRGALQLREALHDATRRVVEDSTKHKKRMRKVVRALLSLPSINGSNVEFHAPKPCRPSVYYPKFRKAVMRSNAHLYAD